MKVAFSTLGCRVNMYESEAMIEKFIKEGYELVDFTEVSDVYVINTCTVTNMGDKKSRQIIHRAKRLNKDAVIAVVGCYSQIAPDEVAALEGVDVVLGTRNKGDIVYWVNRAINDKCKIVNVTDNILKDKKFEELKIDDYQNKTRAFLKIQDGCNRFCSYCLIPYARGAVCSKDPKVVLDEVRSLAEHGFKEVILSGIHTASYGLDFDKKITLMDILEEVDKVDGIERIRIGSIDPTFFTEDVKDRLVKLKHLCPHFHLSLQSGCDDTLKRMNRRYTTKEYRDIVTMLRNAIPDVSITTDVIVGFPGETKEEFETTYKFLKDIKLSKMHIFKYSPRKGTKAAEMKNQIHGTIKEERSKALLELNIKNEDEFMNRFIGRELTVLFEEAVSSEEGKYMGYTPNYIRTICSGTENLIGTIKKVKITDAMNEHLIGKVL